MKANRKGSNEAVSEVIGTVLLLGIAIALFALLHIIVFSYPFNPPPPSVSLIGTVDDEGMIVLEHLGGDSLGLSTKIIITVGDTSASNTIGDGNYLDDSNGNGEWNIGEKLVINPEMGASGTVEVTVVDVESNSIVMMGKIREGTS